MNSALDKWDSVEAPEKSALDRWDGAGKAAKAQAPAANEDQPGKIVSAAAGAGAAFGKATLGLQQWLGKATTALGDYFSDEPTLSSLISPKRNALQRIGDWLDKDAAEGAKKLEAENAPYAKANPVSNFGGEVVGLVAHPVNKLIPGGGATTTAVGAVAKGAAQGAALNVATSPVTEGNFVHEKIKQAVIGALGGGAAGGLVHGVGKVIDKGIDLFRRAGNKIATKNVDEAAENIISSALGDAKGVIVESRPELLTGIKEQVKDALQAGQKVDKAALDRLARAETLPVRVPMLKGQVTRDPMQYAVEQNLRGIQGVGEPIQGVLKAQNDALFANLDALGAKSATDVVTAGKTAIDALKSADKKASADVGAAYKAFKDSTGKSLDVPLPGIAHDYAKTLNEFGDAIPGVIRQRFDAIVGPTKTKAQKLLTIEDAEGLIKTINRNYDPANKVQARALDDLRTAVQRAISEGAGAGAGGEAAALAKAARGAASKRFGLIEETPGLKAAIDDAQPDKFIQRFVLQGNKAEIKSMVDVLSKNDPAALANLQDAVMGHIKNSVSNLNQQGAFSQARLKQFVSDPNMSARLTELLGKDKMSMLRQLNSVAEDALYAPVASAVNRSNTASAAANLVRSEVQGGAVNKLLDVLQYVPSHIVREGASAAKGAVAGRRAGKFVEEAVNPSVAQSGANTAFDTSVARLRAKLRPDVAAARAGVAYIEDRRRRTDQP